LPHTRNKKKGFRSPAILIVPACERGKGGGHLSRSLLLLRSLRVKGRDAYLWIPEKLKDDFFQRFREFFITIDRPCILSLRKQLDVFSWDFIVLDCFRSSPDEFAFWANIAPLIGIDEGGRLRNRFDFLIDLLPSLSRHEPNLSAPGLLPLPRNRRDAGNFATGLCILISFGAEDTAGLGPATARALDRIAAKCDKAAGPNTLGPLDITLIAPIPPHDSSGKLEEFACVKVIGKIPNLQEQLKKYDLIITHFGLGAFEAVYARLPVLVISPTSYHEKLAKNAGFFSLGLGPRSAYRLEKFALDRAFLEMLKGRGKEIARRFALEDDQKEDLSNLVHNLALRSPRCCPACEKKLDASRPILARTTEESYRRCPACSTIYLSRLNAPPIEYEKDYFFDFYKKQYGKTYLEDFPNLVEMGKKRLTVIKTFLEFHHAEAQGSLRSLRRLETKLSLLDIGCAYGPFLVAAAECGFSPVGIDPIEDAVRYVKDELGFPARHGFFHEGLVDEFGKECFDVITLWYVIEHFEEPGKVLTDINLLLKTGGVLAFSTPSFSGISARKNLRGFLKNSPPDHFTIWSPRSCKKILKQYGFALKKIVVTGHHPERFPLFGRFADPRKKDLLYRLLLLVSRLFRLGDTFEAYGVKV
jgi:2-polyprenyl-3-methyl-5-hydroxy-6-metoxy-1,4-benzoquinol methylase